MTVVHPSQIRAARGLLKWSQGDLANFTGLSINTIRQIECETVAPRGSTTKVICKIIGEAGIEFIPNEGVQRRPDSVKAYRGSDSCDLFFKDMLQTICGTNGEVLVLTQSRGMLATSWGVMEHRNLERITQVKALACVKCIIWENDQASGDMPFQFRVLPKQQMGASSCFVYGDKWVLFYRSSMTDLHFTVSKCPHLAQIHRDHFYSLWNIATS